MNPDAHTITEGATCETAKECGECGMTFGTALGHRWEDATCDTPKTCLICNKTEGEALGHTPEADDDDCTTAITCKDCGKVTTAAKTSHIPEADDGDCTTPIKCTECDAITTESKAHDYTGELQKDASGHWHVCENAGCSVTDTKADHISDGAATEEKAEKCTVCEYVIAPELEHTHNHNIPKYNAESHWLECACGDKFGATLHDTNIDDGDCTTADVCSCGYTVRGAKNHVASEDDGNCTTPVKCADCDKIAVAGNESHVDADHDYVCDNDGCQITLDAPEDEAPGIDLPMDKD
jgi:hypothetical protein